jgi:PAS domain S-box-containing protein
VTSLTQQTALNLEYSRLFRAAELRANQLQALTGAAAIISSNLQPEELVGSLLDQLEAILPFNTGTLWLRQDDQMFVHGTRGFADSDVRTGLSILIEDSVLLREMIDTCQAIYVGDVRDDPRFPSLVENPNRSWLGLPLVAGGEVIGVIALEKDDEDFYSAEHIQIATAFAGQAAVALENANLYQQIVSRATELDQRSQRLEMLNRFSTQLSSSLDPDHLLSIILQELIEILNCTAVSAVMLDTSGTAVLKAELPSREVTIPRTIPDAPIFERLRQTLGVYYCEDVSSEEELAPLMEYLDEIGTQSLLALSLATGSDLHGILLVHSAQPYHYTGDEVGLAKTISNQAAIAIQNGRLYAETSSLTNELDQRVRERTEQLARAHQRTETLLRLITELSASLDLEQVLTRTLKVLNQIIDAEHITVLLARTGEKKLHHLASVGYQTALTTDEFFTSLDPDQGLAGWIIQQRKPVLIPDVRDDPRWVQLPNSTVEYRSAIGVPLLIGGVSLGTLLFFHRRVDHFSMDQLDMVQAAANQVAIAVNNAELYRLIRDQAEDLGNMVRSQQIETQRTKAMLEDVADGVLVTDETMRITLFNDSAEEILGLNRSNVIGKSLEHFIGIFGRAAKAWMGTIRTWSQNPDSFTHGDTYAEQIDLDNGRVVSVHLAPVNLRDNFLGTVSIFRDITHQVEVDRLKSEFVATVSHELRTPMTSIKGYVDILLMGAAGPLTNQQVHFLEIVKNNSERLAILVNDLLDISRIESGRLNLSIQHFDLAPLAHETTTDLARRSQEDNKPMQIETDIPRKLPRVLGDPEQVRRIIENLLENAYYYTAEGGRILVRMRRVDDDVQVDIQDTGIGIPLDLQPRVFERFYRGEHPFVLATSGTGLGLSIVKHLVDMHKGKIWLESSGVPGEGSNFSFTLPVYNPEK